MSTDLSTANFPSAEQYRKAFQDLQQRGQIDEKHRLLLRAHYNAPDRTITARRLGEQVGYDTWRGVNSHYGSLARLLCGEFGIEEPPPPAGVWLTVLATWTRDPGIEDGELLLILRPQVAQALADLRWVP